MDVALSFISALSNPVLDLIAVTLHNDIFFAIVMAALVLLRERSPDKIRKIIFAVVLVLVLASAFKTVLRIERPCASERFADLCPESYSFPSLHSAIAFTVAAAFLQKKQYPYYALFALFIAFTRLYLGVHSFDDIVGGMAFGIVGYYLTDLIIEHPQHHTIIYSLERRRKLFHIILGIGLLAFLFLFGRFLFLAMLFFTIFFGSIAANLYSLGKFRAINFLRDNFERAGVKIIGLGAALYLLGILISASILQSEVKIAAAIVIFALGDGAASLFGLHARHHLSWNRKKTWEGLIAFIIFSLPAYFFIGVYAIPLALICAFVESLSLPVDDNLLLPVAASAFLMLI